MRVTELVVRAMKSHQGKVSSSVTKPDVKVLGISNSNQHMSDFSSGCSFRKSITLRETSNQGNSSIRNSIVSGSLAGMAVTLCFYPLEMLRTKIQTFTHSNGIRCSPIAILRNTVDKGGYCALYRGASLPFIAQAFYKSTIFTSNQIFHDKLLVLRSEQKEIRITTLDAYDIFLCGAMSGAINAILFATPVEYIRSQLIVSCESMKEFTYLRCATATPKGPTQIVRNTIISNGVIGLWRGVKPVVIKDFFGNGCFFVVLYTSREMLKPHFKNGDSHFLTIITGSLAGITLWSVALPIDSLKTAVQTGRQKNMMSALSSILKQHGVLGIKHLYRGLPIVLARAGPSAALSVATYEYFISHL